MSSKLDKILKRRKGIYKDPPKEDQFVVYGDGFSVPVVDGDIVVYGDKDKEFSTEMYVQGNMVIDGEVTYTGALKYDLKKNQMLVYDGDSWRPLPKEPGLLSPSPAKIRFITTVGAAAFATAISAFLLLSFSYGS